VWAREGYTIGGTCGIIQDEEQSKHTVGGVTIIWKQGRVGSGEGATEPEVRVIHPRILVRVELQVDIGKKATIYGVYMPHAGTGSTEMGHAWDTFDEATGEGKGAHGWVVGDLKAATGDENTGEADRNAKKIPIRNARARNGNPPR
jgi:hypothetical protein